jgi:hypothetical protein
MSQIKPLGTGAPIWESEASVYPDLLKMPMADGQVITYRREIEQPHPQCVKAVELIRMMKDTTFGGYKGKHTKKGR